MLNPLYNLLLADHVSPLPPLGLLTVMPVREAESYRENSEEDNRP